MKKYESEVFSTLSDRDVVYVPDKLRYRNLGEPSPYKYKLKRRKAARRPPELPER